MKRFVPVQTDSLIGVVSAAVFFVVIPDGPGRVKSVSCPGETSPKFMSIVCTISKKDMFSDKKYI